MKKTKVLISIDEPKLAKTIVYSACSYLDKNNTEITLINVIEDNVPEREYFLEAPQKFIEHEAAKSDFAYIENYIENEGFDYKGFLYKEGDAAKNIVEIAEKEDFNLIVVGSHNKTQLARLFLGSVSYKVAMHSKCSVLVIKPSYSPEISAETKYSALLAVDGSDYSKYVTKHLKEIIDNKRADLTVLNVIVPIQEIIPPDAYIYTDIDKIIEETNIVSNEILLNASTELIKQNFNVIKKYHTEGDPADTILQEAKKNNSHIIIVGSHGRTGISRWLMGNVGHKVYTHSDRPVLIIKSK